LRCTQLQRRYERWGVVGSQRSEPRELEADLTD
jgi:hypothetical protein